MVKKSYSRIADTQLNIRTDIFTAHAFRSFCNRTQLTQNEALKLLLQSAGQNIYERFDPMQARLQQEETIAELQRVNDELRHEHAARQNIFVKRRNDWLQVMDELLEHIIDRRGTHSDKNHEPLRIKRFKFAKESLNFKAYQYPASTGCMIITLDYISYGKGLTPPLFICGKDAAGTLVKLRWYPKAEYIGISPRSEIYSYEGSQWLTGYLQVSDGATDMVAGIPLNSILTTAKQTKPNSLDTLIALATKQKNT